MKIDQSGGKGDYDLKQQQQQQQSMRSIGDSQNSQNTRNPSSVLQNSHADSNVPRATGLPQPKPIATKRSPTEEPPQRQNGTNGKANVRFNHFHQVSKN